MAKPNEEFRLLPMGDTLAETLKGGILMGFAGEVGADVDDADVLT